MNIVMTFKEAEEFALKENLTSDNLKKNYGNYYNFEVINSIGKDDFVTKVENLIYWRNKRQTLVTEVSSWLKDNQLPWTLYVNFDLNAYLAAGVIPMKDMEEGYYLGKCRNNIIGYWDPKSKMFIHTRDSWNLTFTEKIPHLEEIDYAFDLFIPKRKIDISEISENFKIDKWEDGYHSDHKHLIENYKNK